MNLKKKYGLKIPKKFQLKKMMRIKKLLKKFQLRKNMD